MPTNNTAWGYKEPEIRHEKTGAIGAVTPMGDTVYGPMAQQFLTAKPPTQPTVAEEAEQTPPVFQQPEPTVDVSLQAQLDKQRKTVEDSYKKELERLNTQIEEQKSREAEYLKKQEGVMAEADPLTQPFRAGIETSERERLKVEENYFANQAIVNELDQLLTESIEMTRRLQTQRVPGLAGLQQSSRMTKAAEGVQSRIAVLEAVMSARNDQIGTALNFIDRTVGQMTNDRNARLDYLNSLFNFYENTKNDAGQKVFNLTKEQKDIFNRQTALLEADMARTQANADRIKEMMQENPLMVAQSGISLNDTEEQISKKLAEWQYSEEVRSFKNKAQEKGIKPIDKESLFLYPPEKILTYTDSKGKENYFVIPTEWKTQVVGKSLYRYDPQTGQREMIIYGGEDGGVDGELSSLSLSVAENPNLFTSLTATKKEQVLQELRANGYNTRRLGDKPLSDTAIKEITQLNFALLGLDDLTEKIQNNLSLIGPVRGLQALNPYSPARMIQADIDRIRQTVGKALEGGVLRKEDEEKYKKILATITDTPETALYKLNQLKDSISANLNDYKLQQSLSGKSLDIDSPLEKIGENNLGLSNTNTPALYPEDIFDSTLMGIPPETKNPATQQVGGWFSNLWQNIWK